MNKILFLEQFANISGGQKVLLNILAGLDRSEYAPYVALPSAGELTDELKKINVPYFVLPIGTYSAGGKNAHDYLRYCLRSVVLIILLLRIIKKHKIALVYANAPRTYLWGTLAAKMAKVPIVWHLHSTLSGWELKYCLGLIKIGVVKLIAISKTTAQPFLQANKSLKARIDIVYNGVNTEEYSPDNDGVKLKNILTIPENYKIVGFVGQIVKWKGIEDLLRAAKLVIGNYQEVIFIIVGDVLFGGGKERKYNDHLQGLVANYHIKDNIIFLGKRNNIPEIMAAFDILVVPSRDPEPFGLVMIEGMASAKVVLATNQGGPAEIITNEFNGLLFEPRNYNELSDKILELLKSNEKRNRLGRNARETVLNKYTLRGFQQKINRLISDVIGEYGK